MSPIEDFDQALTKSEQQKIAQLTIPVRIQGFLDELPYSIEKGYRCPLLLVRLWEYGMEEGMDKDHLAEMIRRRLKLDDEEWTIVKENPKFQRLFENAMEASKYRLVAEVIDSKGCHSGHVVGQKLIFDNSGNLLTKENPDRVCSFLMPNLTILINAFFENLMNGRDPNEVMFNTTGCFDTGPSCGGWGHVVVKMAAVKK